MRTQDVGADDIARVFPAVAEIVADALAREVEEVALESRLIEDLGAESIDFLDVVFRLEQRFAVQIARGQIVEDARGELSEDEFERDGRLTDAAIERLRGYLTEVPAERFRPRMRTAEIPLLFTVATFCKLVVRAERSRDR
jgi:acyl carrier protein